MLPAPAPRAHRHHCWGIGTPGHQPVVLAGSCIHALNVEVAIEHVQVLVQACAERSRIRTAVRIALLCRPAAQGIGDAGGLRLVQVLRLHGAGGRLQHRIPPGRPSPAPSIQETAIIHPALRIYKRLYIIPLMDLQHATLGTLLRALLDQLDPAVEQAYRHLQLDYRPRYTPVLRTLMAQGPCRIGPRAGLRAQPFGAQPDRGGDGARWLAAHCQW